jgi:hypothetical protein
MHKMSFEVKTQEVANNTLGEFLQAVLLVAIVGFLAWTVQPALAYILSH